MVACMASGGSTYRLRHGIPIVSDFMQACKMVHCKYYVATCKNFQFKCTSSPDDCFILAKSTDPDKTSPSQFVKSTRL